MSMDVVIVKRWSRSRQKERERERERERESEREKYIQGDPVKCNRLFCYLIEEENSSK